MKKTPIGSKIKNYWIDTPGLFAEKYADSYTSLISPAKAFLYSRRKKVLKLVGDLEGKQVLDIGCGSGIFMVDFIKRGARVTGVDYSQKMLDMAKDLFKQQKINSGKFKLIKADATKLPLNKPTFDIVLATGLADYLTLDQNKLFLAQASKVLKKDGMLICGFPAQDSRFAFLRQGAGLWLRENVFKLPPIQSNFSLKQIQTLLKNVDLKDVEHSKVFQTMWIVVAKHA